VTTLPHYHQQNIVAEGNLGQWAMGMTPQHSSSSVTDQMKFGLMMQFTICAN